MSTCPVAQSGPPGYLLEAGLLETSGGGAHGMVGSGGRVDEVEELVCGLWASSVHHGHGAEEGEGGVRMGTMDCTD